MTARAERESTALVIGGGVIGLAVAHELVRRGLDVLLLERDRIAAAATSVAAGMLAPVSEAATEPRELVAFGLDSLARYPQFVAQVEQDAGESCGLEAGGTLWIALDRDEAGELSHTEETLRSRGLSCRRLARDEVLRLEPHLAGRLCSGLEVLEDRHVDPRRLATALERAISRRGGRIRTGVEVGGIEPRPRGGFEVRTASSERFGARFVVVAAGAWSTGRLLGPLGRTGVRPVKGQLVRLRGAALIGRMVRSPRVYLVPRPGGELLVGATVEEVGYDTVPTAGAVLDLLRAAWEILPGIYELELVEVSVGLRSAVEDQLPVIGELGAKGLFAAYGHFRNGVLLAPATAHYLAEWIERGTAPGPLAPFVADRRAARLSVPG